MTKIEKAILKTIAFFDLSQKPLLLDEIWHFLPQTKTSKIKVLIGLQKLEKNAQISKKNEYYFLRDKENFLTDSAKKEKLLALYWKKVRKFAKLFQYAPFVQNVSVVGSLASGTVKKNSDINLIIIARKNRAWLAKFFITAILEIVGQNKNRWYRSEKFSVDFVLDESNLGLSSLKFKKDNYSAHWLANLTPIFDRGTYKKLITANTWIYKELPNWEEKETDSQSYRYTAFEKFLLSYSVRNLWERLKKFSKIRTTWESFLNKTHRTEQALAKTISGLKRKEFHLKWQKATKISK